jgi:pyrroline-5-carboxylate reductase
MPNLPVKYNKGVIGFFGENTPKAEEINLFDALSSVGIVLKLKSEKEIDTMTLISACGPAVVSDFIEMFESYAKKEGLSKETASVAVRQTFLGTLDYLNKSGVSPFDFMKSVATKGGITEAILKNLDKEFKKKFTKSMGKGLIKIKKINK